MFILASNHLSIIDILWLLDEYKSQRTVERGFRVLKSPEFLTAALFLKKPERIEALLMVMTCSLMVYVAIEYLIRRQLKHHNAYFPDMKNKPYQNSTARWVFLCFQGIDELTISGSIAEVLNLSDSQKIILNCLGKTYQEVYSCFYCGMTGLCHQFIGWAESRSIVCKN